MFKGYEHPRLAAIALAGGGWWLVGLVLWLAGPPQMTAASALIHLLGLATVLVTGLVYGFLWWRDYIRSKL